MLEPFLKYLQKQSWSRLNQQSSSVIRCTQKDATLGSNFQLEGPARSGRQWHVITSMAITGVYLLTRRDYMLLNIRRNCKLILDAACDIDVDA